MNKVGKLAIKVGFYALCSVLSLILIVLHYDKAAREQAIDLCNSVKVGDTIESARTKFKQSQALKGRPQLKGSEIVAVFKAAAPEHICTIYTKNGIVTTKTVEHTNK